MVGCLRFIRINKIANSQVRNVWESRKMPTEFELLDKEDPYSYYRGQVPSKSRFYHPMYAAVDCFNVLFLNLR